MKIKPNELKGMGYSHSEPFYLNNRKVQVIKCHTNEGIDKEIITNVLSKAREKFPNVHRRGRGRSYFVTEVVSRLPPIRMTVVFRELKDRVVVLNAFLGSINSKNIFEHKIKLDKENILSNIRK